MRRNERFLSLVVMILFSQIIPIGGGAAETTRLKKYESWIAPRPDEQFRLEGKDDQRGFGRIFIPVMSSNEWVPNVTIYRGGELVRDDASMGESVFLEPGEYRVVFGSGIYEEQRLERTVEVESEEAVIVPVDWAGLIVRIIDPSRNFLVQNYEIFDMESEETHGMSVSKDENQPDEHPDTWLLRPGLYKITRAGAPFNTSTNFATARLLPGTLTQFTVVIDEISGNFMGAGILKELETQSMKKTFFTHYSALNGSANLSSDNRADRDEFVTNINLSTRFDNRFLYDDRKQYFLSEPSHELVLSRTGQRSMHISTDRLLFNNIYIYYFVPAFGLYGRFDMETKVFPGKAYFDSGQPEIFKMSDGDTLEVVRDADEVVVSPNFSPLKLKEGVGLNFTPVRGNRVRFSIRTGAGFWQYLNNEVYVQSSQSDVVFEKVNSDYVEGLEVSAWGNVQPTSKLVWATKVDVLFPVKGTKKTSYELESLVSYRLLKYTSLEYDFLYSKETSRARGYIESTLWLKLSYIF